MRTTIDLPADLHEVVRQLAHDRRESMSKVAADLMRSAITGRTQKGPRIGPRGMPIISVGHPVTNEDIAALLDEE